MRAGITRVLRPNSNADINWVYEYDIYKPLR